MRMIGSLSKVGVWFVAVVGGANLVNGTLWLVGCSVIGTLWLWPDSLSCLDLGLETSWEGGAKIRNERFCTIISTGI